MIPERVCGVSSILILAERVLVDNASIEVLKQPGCDERLYRIYVVKHQRSRLPGGMPTFQALT